MSLVVIFLKHDKLRQELRIKDESLRKLEENSQILESKIRAKEQQCKTLQEKVFTERDKLPRVFVPKPAEFMFSNVSPTVLKNKDLEGQVESKAQLHTATERQQWQLADKLKGKEEACNALQQKVSPNKRHLNYIALLII